MNKSVAIVGSGFSSLAAACYLARDGYQVDVYEKNQHIGGRARQLLKDGFRFDMGPTWYWMPDVFERFFADFGKRPDDYYTLKRLDPAYSVYFGSNNKVVIPGSMEEISKTFESIEPGSSKHLERFIAKAQDNYNIAIKDLVYKPGKSPLELVNGKTFSRLGQFFSTISKQVRRDIKDPRLISILEFPALFLGAKPSNTPAFYNFMNYADFGLGTWHPMGGMHKVIEGIHSLALELGVNFHVGTPIDRIETQNGSVTALLSNNQSIVADRYLSGADYEHTESLLSETKRGYKASFWHSRTFAPSCLLFYVGFDSRIKNVEHHTLFFDTDFEAHAKEIYDTPAWPKEPLFYASFPTISDPELAPAGCEAGIFLIPIAAGIDGDTEETREKYFNIIMDRFEQLTEQSVRENILFKESFSIKDFIKDYNAYQGNAYGLANTLRQTAFMRPKLKSRKLDNFFFTGQLTVPGPGVPPSLISGKLASELIQQTNQ